MTDAHLARLAAAGDHDAFEGLYAKYSRFIERCAMHFCLPNDAIVGDVAQETWLGLLEGRWRLASEQTGDGHLYRFLFTLVRLTALHAREAPYVEISQPGVVYCLAVLHHHDDTIGGLISAQQRALLRWAVAALPRRDRELLQLRYGDGLTCRALAERVGRSMQTIAERLADIHGRLARFCGVPYRPVRKGHYSRDVAFTHRPMGRRTLTADEQQQLQAARRAARQPQEPSA